MRSERKRQSRLLQRKELMVRTRRRSAEQRLGRTKAEFKSLEQKAQVLSRQMKRRKGTGLQNKPVGTAHYQLRFQHVRAAAKQKQVLETKKSEVTAAGRSTQQEISQLKAAEKALGGRLRKLTRREGQELKRLAESRLHGSALAREVRNSISRSEGQSPQLSEQSSEMTLLSGAVQDVLQTVILEGPPGTFSSLQQLDHASIPTPAPQRPAAAPQQTFSGVHYHVAVNGSSDTVHVYATQVGPDQIFVRLVPSGSRGRALLQSAQGRLHAAFSGASNVRVVVDDKGEETIRSERAA